MNMTAMGPFFERRWDSGGVAMDRFPVPNHLDAIPILQSAITSGFSDSLVSLALFGSVARGDFREESDIDLLLVFENLPHGRSERTKYLASKLEPHLSQALKNTFGEDDVPEIQYVLRTKAEVLEGGFLYLDLVTEAKILYDKDAFFQTHLFRFSEKMKAWGSQKIQEGDGYYWIVKPGLKAGELIELGTKE